MNRAADPTPSREFWNGRRVLVTGHTGFKGSWLCAWLEDLGAEVLGLSLPEPPTSPNLWHELHLDSVTQVSADIASDRWQGEVGDFDPEIVLHLAAQALVSDGYSDPFRTFTTNVHGSVRLLASLAGIASARAAVMVTTDKVYDPTQPIPLTENSFLGGKDPYSASKAAMELAVHSWPELSCPVATARAGNVIGGGDWSAHRLLPDVVTNWSKGEPIALRRPTAVRPWQHVLEPLRGYLLYAEGLTNRTLPRSLNFGPHASQCVPVETVVSFAAEHWREIGDRTPDPSWIASQAPSMVETELLVLDSGLAEETVGWRNVLGWQDAVRRTIDWHHALSDGASAHELVKTEIAEYVDLLEGHR